MINSKESMTAKLCAYARAHHSNFIRNKIFDDYLAFDIMGKNEYDEMKNLVGKIFSNEESSVDTGALLNKYISPILLPRIAYAENSLCRFAHTSGEIQYVIMGAGMDTFGFRNANKNIKIFELDHPSTQKYKLKRIEDLMWNIPENLKFVEIDFEVQNLKDVLLNSGFDPNLPSFFTILGVTYYLSLNSLEKTVKNISEITKNKTKIVFDYPDKTTFSAARSKFLADVTALLGEPMQKGFSYNDFKNLFKKFNFEIENYMNPYDIQNFYFKERKDGQVAYKNIHFMTVGK